VAASTNKRQFFVRNGGYTLHRSMLNRELREGHGLVVSTCQRWTVVKPSTMYEKKKGSKIQLPDVCVDEKWIESVDTDAARSACASLISGPMWQWQANNFSLIFVSQKKDYLFRVKMVRRVNLNYNSCIYSLSRGILWSGLLVVAWPISRQHSLTARAGGEGLPRAHGGRHVLQPACLPLGQSLILAGSGRV
jgi:hypothetical protein